MIARDLISKLSGIESDAIIGFFIVQKADAPEDIFLIATMSETTRDGRLIAHKLMHSEEPPRLFKTILR